MNDESAGPRRTPRHGAEAAQAGFDYQLEVSILAALRLLLVTKACASITLEPENAEDIQAILTDGRRLVIQVKLHNGEPWSLADFKALLKHGTHREPAKDLLDDPAVGYLLVTNAAVRGELRDLLIEDFEEIAPPHLFPPSLRTVLRRTPEGRVGILGGLGRRHVELETGELMETVLRVSRSSRGQCLESLKREARSRMQGALGGVWTRDEILHVIRSHGGQLASATELEAFVAPSNFADMLDRLRERNAIVVKGPSGTGKTTAALAICDAIRRSDGATDVVAVDPSRDPSGLLSWANEGPKLFYIEDPWGQYGLRKGSEAWTTQLPNLLRNAHSGRRFVVTTRSDMLGQASAGNQLERWSMELDADHYRDGALSGIFDKRMDILPRGLQPLALSYRREVLEALETPLELDLFFASMADGPLEEEREGDFLRRLLALAHRDAVEGVVAGYLRSADRSGLSAAIWSLLAARGRFDRAQLSAVRSRLRRVERFEGLDKLVDRLVATRHLRQPGRIVSFAHPSVRAGFEQFLKEEWDRQGTALEDFVSVLADLPGQDHEWGLETAARVLDATRALVEQSEDRALDLDIPQETRLRIDVWLETAMLDEDTELEPALELAARIGSDASTPCELARWCVNGVRRGSAWLADDWEPPLFDDEWYGRVAADPRTAPLAGRFVRDVLPFDRDGYGENFANGLTRLAGDLTSAFIDGALSLVGAGYVRNAELVASRAIADPNSYEIVLAGALDELREPDFTDNAKRAETWRAIEDGEVDRDVEEYYSTADHDEGYCSDILVRTYVESKRQAGRWRDLANHGRASELAHHWALEIRRATEAAPVDELLAMLEAAVRGAVEQDAWQAIHSSWHPALKQPLADRLLASADDPELGHILVRCAYSNAPAILATVLDHHADRARTFASILVDVHGVAESEKHPIHILAATIPGIRSDALDVLRALDGAALGVVVPMDTTAARIIASATRDGPPSLLSRLVPLLIDAGCRPHDVVRRWLDEAKGADDAKAAALAAVRIGADDLVDLALRHPRAVAREVSLEYRLLKAQVPIDADVLSLSPDKSHRFRHMLVRALARNPHPAHLPVLVSMARDTWSNQEYRDDGDESFPIARAAVAALPPYGELDVSNVDRLLELAASSNDGYLVRSLLRVLAINGGSYGRAEILRLGGRHKLRWRCVDAVRSLASAPMLEQEIVFATVFYRSARQPIPIACASVELIAAHGPIPWLIAELASIARSPPRRALLVIAAAVLKRRDAEAARRVVAMLGVDHPVARILDPSTEELPRSALDDLGDVRVRRWVEDCLDGRFLTVRN